MAEMLRGLFLNHLIISMCLWVRAPHWARDTSQVLLVGVPGFFFLFCFFRGSSIFAPPGLSHMSSSSEIILKGM